MTGRAVEIIFDRPLRRERSFFEKAFFNFELEAEYTRDHIPASENIHSEVHGIWRPHVRPTTDHPTSTRRPIP
jgi:hypothetical protein